MVAQKFGWIARVITMLDKKENRLFHSTESMRMHQYQQQILHRALQKNSEPVVGDGSAIDLC